MFLVHTSLMEIQLRFSKELFVTIVASVISYQQMHSFTVIAQSKLTLVILVTLVTFIHSFRVVREHMVVEDKFLLVSLATNIAPKPSPRIVDLLVFLKPTLTSEYFRAFFTRKSSLFMLFSPHFLLLSQPNCFEFHMHG